MSVLIKGMKMPTQCYDCYLVAADPDTHCLYCKHTDKDIVDWSARMIDCPLVEVPPHGPLIDGDALKATFCAECNHTITCEDCDIDYHIGRLASTIIEAEEGETC